MYFWFLLFIIPLFAEFAETRTHFLSTDEKISSETFWEELGLPSFKELILSWNALRPPDGRYTFFIRVKQNGQWSPWLYYAEWSAQGQIIFTDTPPHSFATAHEGKVKPKTGTCDGYQVKVYGSGGTDLRGVHNLTVCTCNLDHFKIAEEQMPLDFVFLDGVPRFSQLMTRNQRYNDLALPTAMTILLNHYLREKVTLPADFADKVIDDDTAFYESYSFNIAQASHYLNGRAFLEFSYLSSFATLHDHLVMGYPVIAFISGWFQGCPRPYRMEHAVCVIGYDPVENKVQCIDPGFPNDRATFTSYLLTDFLKGWAKQYNRAILLNNH
jgi:hypothetical protein